ncbi:MAG: helix-turn-helix domain-containing protein [Clostridia bacterium]|nr:helix-turn-helix domain-containing protein [Clostridia bacterium]MBR2467402.1 helix-turn-helix domain-containing protein [Clostridia bacterium]MBR3715465.1 helix-turn-helix domain-containing protein [Clostridia bacterium]
MYDVTHIKNYILYLKNKCGLSVTLHPHGAEKLIIPSELMTFNIHDNSYCVYVKTFPEAQAHCIEKQCKIREKCRGGSFVGTCYAGVREYVYPIIKKGDVCGFISVSAYKTENADSYIKKTSERFGIPKGELSLAYASLNEKMPPKEEIDALVLPLSDMLELAYIKSEGDADASDELVGRVERYVKKNHTRNITLDDVCLEFSCSRSSISHLFKKRTGKSFREYLTDIRIEDAKTLLSYSGLSVTEIALSVGFSDSNYFSGVFKSSTGVTPMAYRRMNKK